MTAAPEITASRETGNTASREKRSRPRGYLASYNPQAKTLALLDEVKAVLDEYREYLPLTARQIYYRLIGAYGHPKTEAFYSNLCEHLGNARRGGLIPFEAIRDDGVTTINRRYFADEDDFKWHLRSLAQNYRRDLMATQPYHVEVWCEAAGMLQQLESVARQYSIRVFSSGGFDSLTAKKDIADRIIEVGKPAIILHLGDYDPSGESIFRSSAEDVTSFVLADRANATVTVDFRRVALTAGQVKAFDLPTAPAKASDSRSRSWSGGTCQLEALTPRQIAQILDEAIRNCLAPAQLHFDREQEQVERHRVTKLLLAAPEARP